MEFPFNSLYILTFSVLRCPEPTPPVDWSETLSAGSAHTHLQTENKHLCNTDVNKNLCYARFCIVQTRPNNVSKFVTVAFVLVLLKTADIENDKKGKRGYNVTYVSLMLTAEQKILSH